jgi:hypothetical protein
MRLAPYRLTPAGEQLVPTLMSLWHWGEKWVPEDPVMAERDPTVILWWLRHRVDGSALPERQVAIEFAMGGSAGEARSWLLLARGTEPELCLEDPLLGQERHRLPDPNGRETSDARLERQATRDPGG